MSKTKLSIVDFTGGVDGVHALYINDELYKYGDYYHNKIQDWIVGFKAGLEYAKIDFVEERLEIVDGKLIEEVSECGDVPPKFLSIIEDHKIIRNG